MRACGSSLHKRKQVSVVQGLRSSISKDSSHHIAFVHGMDVVDRLAPGALGRNRLLQQPHLDLAAKEACSEDGNPLAHKSRESSCNA